MFRRAAAFLLTLFLLTALLVLPVSADTGPKASVEVTLKNIDHPCYVTLLSAGPTTGPFNDVTLEKARFDLEGDTDGTILEQLITYALQDDFYLLDNIELCEDRFIWNYYPPDTFKLLVYDPETSCFAESEVLSQYAFTSSFSADLSCLSDGGGTLTVTRSYRILPDLLNALFCCGVTIGVELLIALPFLLWKKPMLKVLIPLNLCTQLLLNAGLAVYVYFSGSGFWMTVPYFFAELLVFLFEGYFCYTLFPHDIRHRLLRTWGYALAANACSFLLGVFFYL